MTGTTMLSAALDLAVHGWSVLPCHPSGPKAKAPLLEHGHLDATQDPGTITAWWTRWPDAMIGCPVPESLLVLDVDPRNGGSFELLQEAPLSVTIWRRFLRLIWRSWCLSTMCVLCSSLLAGSSTVTAVLILSSRCRSWLCRDLS
jgi:hypothetical protein